MNTQYCATARAPGPGWREAAPRQTLCVRKGAAGYTWTPGKKSRGRSEATGEITELVYLLSLGIKHQYTYYDYFLCKVSSNLDEEIYIYKFCNIRRFLL